MSLRLAVLGSGSGSNCQSIFNAIADGRLDAEVVIVLSDHEDAYILERARQHGVRAEYMDCGGEQFYSLFQIVIAFYFGTQFEKKKGVSQMSTNIEQVEENGTTVGEEQEKKEETKEETGGAE